MSEFCIYEKVTQSPLFKDLFIETFGDSQNLNVTFKVVDELPEGHENSNAITDPTVKVLSDTGAFHSLDVDILVKRSHLQADSGMLIGLTVIHEAIHAYLYALKYGADGTEIGDFDIQTLGETLNDLYNNENDDVPTSQVQHTFMFENLVPTIAQILEDIRDSTVPPSHITAAEDIPIIDVDNPTEYLPWDWQEFYNLMSLFGLQNTPAFQEEYPTGSNEYTKFQTYSNTGAHSFGNPCKN